MKTQHANHPMLYVGTYAKYNSGSIAGDWLDLSEYSTRDEFLEAAAALHSDEQDPELMFQDFQGFPEIWYSESSAPPAILWEWIEMEEWQKEAFGLYAENVGPSIDDFLEKYAGTAESRADFTENQAIETDAIPADFPSWIIIDWEATWNCSLRYDYWCERGESGELHFFEN
jgi:antirestriction protein